ncbi:MAG: uroporphyrinogen-III synthase [Desulfuromonadales bacterium]|nr:uroporphyrinogen-III synthase [Desulfuromonadales bacterium]
MDAPLSVHSTLEGKRILVTRAADQAKALVEPLRRLGAEPIAVATIEIAPPASYAELDQALAGLAQTDFVVLTSANAVKALFERMQAQRIDLALLNTLKLVTVGPKTAQALAAYGFSADLVPKDFRAEGVVALLAGQVAGKRLLYPKAALARDLIPGALTAAGAEVADPIAYASVAPQAAAEQLTQALHQGLDLLTFTASSTVRNFVNLLDASSLSLSRQIPLASIGPLTTRTAQDLGFNVVVEPQDSTLDAMIEAIKAHFHAQVKTSVK